MIGLVMFAAAKMDRPALRHAEQEALGSRSGMAVALENLGTGRIKRGEHAEAILALERALALRESLDDRIATAGCAARCVREPHPRFSKYAERWPQKPAVLSAKASPPAEGRPHPRPRPSDRRRPWRPPVPEQGGRVEMTESPARAVGPARALRGRSRWGGARQAPAPPWLLPYRASL